MVSGARTEYFHLFVRTHRPVCDSLICAKTSVGQSVAPAEALLCGETERYQTTGVTQMHYYYSLRRYALGAVANYSYNGIPYPGRHNDGNNVAFCDGHAKWIGTNTMIDRNWSGWTAQPFSL